MELPKSMIRLRLNDHVANGCIGEFDGLLLLEKRNQTVDRANGLNCLQYLMRKFREKLEVDIHFSVNDFPCPIWTKGYHRVSDPQKNDLAVYLDTLSPCPEQVHIGVMRTRTLVESKWSYGHVFMHEPSLVPTYFGNRLLFFRR